MTRRQLYQSPVDPLTPSSQDTIWQAHYKKILDDLQGTQSEKQGIIRKRILKYFGEFKMDTQSYFSIRNNVDYLTSGIQIITSSLILFGVDYLTIQRAKKMFPSCMTNIRRMDDSHFIVDFRNSEECLTALNRAKLKTGSFFCSPQNVMEESVEGWIDLKPYQEFIFQRNLMARYRTSLDKVDNVCVSTKQSYAFAYAEARRRFMKALDIGSGSQKKISGRREGSRDSRSSRSSFGNLQRQRQFSRSRDKNLSPFQNMNFCYNCMPCHCHIRQPPNFQTHMRPQMRPRLKQNYSDLHEKKMRPKSDRAAARNNVSQANFEFEMYIRKRDQSKINSSFSNRLRNNLTENREKISTEMQSTSCQQTTSKNHKMQQVAEAMNDSSLLDFENFLDQLKLDESRIEIPTFELDDN